jgi:DNA-binding response OmpR family regulator
MDMKRILVADDQVDIRNLLVLNLHSAGYEVTEVGDGLAALAAETERAHDVLILDLMMPGLDGLEVCKALRARGNSTPILMLTAKSTELDRVLGLELGADDYLTKPFSLAELLARVKALLRRAELLRTAQQHAHTQSTVLTNGALEIVPVRREVLMRGKALDTVTTHINRLRAKLETDPLRPELILTVRGAGYKMRDAPR